MTSSDTPSWLAELGRRELRPGTWTLEVIVELCRRLGEPQRRFRAVHVAGTRGKGSTCALVESAARAAGLRTGLTTSPHLVSPRERIRIDGADLAEPAFWPLVERVRRAGEGLLPGYFEVLTAAAFVAFAEGDIDVAVVETGLGGRVDATNVVLPLVTVITRLGLDHADRLGPTRADVAREKAGILKPGVRAVLAPCPAEAAAVVVARALEIGAPLREVVEADVLRAPPPAIPGRVQRENAAVALVALEELAMASAALQVGPEAVARGFASVRWPARLELLRGALGGVDLLLDVAHDVDGARALVEHVSGAPPQAMVFACLADKDAAGIARELLLMPGIRRIPVLVPALGGARGRDPEALAEALRASGLDARSSGGVGEALDAAAAIARRSGTAPLVVAFGSFQVASRVLEALGPAG